MCEWRSLGLTKHSSPALSSLTAKDAGNASPTCTRGTEMGPAAAPPPPVTLGVQGAVGAGAALW